MRKYLSTTVTTFKNAQVYRMDILLKLFGSFLLIIALKETWTSIYNGQISLADQTGVAIDSMTTYAMISAMFLLLFNDELLTYEIAGKVYDGNIIYELQKPMNFQLFYFSKNMAIFLSSIVYQFAPLFLVTYFLFPTFTLPSWVNLIGFIISMIFSSMIFFAFSFLISLLSFRFTEIWGFVVIQRAIVQFCSGSFIPIWFFPNSVITLLNILPFRGIYSIPLSIFIEKTNGKEIIFDLLFQIIWIIILYFVGHVGMKLMSKRLMFSGG